jgi:nucleoside-diphosphate-sugar epimerase
LNKKILIIGGNGFLGYNLSKKLKKLDYEILLLCRKKNHKLKNIQGVKYIFCDLIDLNFFC